MKKATPEISAQYAKRHFKFGWWTLLVFGSMGIALEAMHGLKVQFYLDVFNETRRLMWTLAHAHGVLLALVHIAFAATLNAGALEKLRRPQVTSLALMGASVTLPGGFLLGGAIIHGGDPSLGVFLVPVGSVLLVGALFLIAIDTARS